MPNKQRFWFYSGRHAERLARTKAQGVLGAKVMNREEVKARRLSIPKAELPANTLWAWVVVAPAEAAADDDE
jgi:hypothetical protein